MRIGGHDDIEIKIIFYVKRNGLTGKVPLPQGHKLSHFFGSFLGFSKFNRLAFELKVKTKIFTTFFVFIYVVQFDSCSIEDQLFQGAQLVNQVYFQCRVIIYMAKDIVILRL